MMREKVLSAFEAAVLAFCIGFGGAACLVTGFDLPVKWTLLVIGCAIVAIAAAIIFSFKWGGVITAAMSLMLLLHPNFLPQAKALGRSVLVFYNRGYGVPIPAWLDGEKVESQFLVLLLIAGLVAAAVAWTVLRRKRSYLAVTAAILPLVCCLVVTSTVPDVGAIFCLLLGLVLLVLTQSVRRQDAAQANRLTAMLFIPAALGLVLLFSAIPKENFSAPDSFRSLEAWVNSKLPFMGTTSEGELVISFGGKSPEKVDLSDAGERNLPPTPVMEITSEFSDILYLRGRDYDLYDGKSWSSTPERIEKGFGLGIGWAEDAGTVSVKVLSRRGQYYVPYYAKQKPTFYGGMLPNDNLATEYSFQCGKLRKNWQALLTGDAEWEDIARYVALPEQTRKRAETILADLNLYKYNDVEKAFVIREFVRKSAEYSLNTGKMPAAEEDFALWFLESSDTGYCVHFASATAVLLRAAGIQARYVEGYTVPVTKAGTTIVREHHAHAWVEYYIPDVGWLVLDATPAADETHRDTTPATDETTRPATTEATKPQQTGPSNSGGNEKKDLSEGFDIVVWIFAAVVGAVVLTAVQWALRRRWKMRRMYRGKGNAQALARFR